LLKVRSIDAQWMFSLLPYGVLWRQKRKLMHGYVHAGVADRYYPIQIAAARRFARDIPSIVPEKEALPPAIRFSFGQTILKIVHGINVDGHESEYIALPEQVIERAAKAVALGRYLVDAFLIRTCFA
jgi:hypothetical protein